MSIKTLTLQTNEDVLLRLEQQAQQEQTTLEAIAEEALRRHASSLPQPSTNESQSKTVDPKPYRMKTHFAGRCYLDNLDKTWEVIAWAEGEDFK